jgi:hypothetical protein
MRRLVADFDLDLRFALKWNNSPKLTVGTPFTRKAGVAKETSYPRARVSSGHCPVPRINMKLATDIHRVSRG